ncbi:hypothetical protein PY093_13970 [Cytobacillus sp. S13-E01]|uniref:hypothetical protein n=1 Tax=Cytobacillus sp. S13-E01 TaxID=3031326 RepID=UPI0023D8C783|nr:hypothetical protein [Cytobacillus sp. S13-E01]MDF0727782.1 hypothetical protein [Cytobacillus sp. S13-E01]
MKKLFILSICAFVLMGCGGDKEEKAKTAKKDEKTIIQEEGIARIQAQTELGTLGFTPEELQENWNSAQDEMKEEDSYQIKQLNVTNGEFRTDVGEGVILEGIVNEETNEVSKLSVIRKEVEAEQLSQSLHQFEDTIASFFLLVAVTNKEEKVSEEQINTMVHDLVILETDKDMLDAESSLNNVTYMVEENERGLVMTATQKKD